MHCFPGPSTVVRAFSIAIPQCCQLGNHKERCSPTKEQCRRYQRHGAQTRNRGEGVHHCTHLCFSSRNKHHFETPQSRGTASKSVCFSGHMMQSLGGFLLSIFSGHSKGSMALKVLFLLPEMFVLKNKGGL